MTVAKVRTLQLCEDLTRGLWPQRHSTGHLDISTHFVTLNKNVNVHEVELIIGSRRASQMPKLFEVPLSWLITIIFQDTLDLARRQTGAPKLLSEVLDPFRKIMVESPNLTVSTYL